MDDLQPTLWRTSRILANPMRISCLKEVLAYPGRSVEEIASHLQIAENQASMCLRALQARGLIRAARHSRWVRYTAIPDPLVPSARPVLKAMGRALLENDGKESEIIRALTAFTHPRRLLILRGLQQTPWLSDDAMEKMLQISQSALSRHLAKLESRGLVLNEDHKWRLLPCRSEPSRTFLNVLASGRP